MSEKERATGERITEKVNKLDDAAGVAVLAFLDGMSAGKEIGRREGYDEAMREKAAEAEGEKTA